MLLMVFFFLWYLSWWTS